MREPHLEHFHRQLDDGGPWLMLGNEILNRPPVLVTAAVAVGADGRDLAVVLEEFRVLPTSPSGRHQQSGT